MRTKNKLVSCTLGVAFFLLWVIPSVSLGYDAGISDQSADEAMRSFINAMVRKDKNAVLGFFSKKVPCKKLFFEIGATKPSHVSFISYERLARDFQQKEGLYHFFFDEPNGYTFQVNFNRNVMWKKKEGNTFVYPESYLEKTYIKWKRIDGKWVIAEIGDTGP